MILPGTKRMDQPGEGFRVDVQCQQCQRVTRVAFAGWAALSCPCGAEIERGPHYSRGPALKETRRRVCTMWGTADEEARLMELAEWLECSPGMAIRAAVDAAHTLYREKGTK